jgi:integrase
MSYTLNGKQYRESTETSDLDKAKLRLAQRIASQAVPAKGTVSTLLDAVIEDYEINGKGVEFARQWIDNHLRPFFGSMKPDRVTTHDIRRFQSDKLKAQKPLSPASVNRALALLRRAYTLAEIKPPRIEKLRDDNVRKGFVGDDDFWRLYSELAPHLRPLTLFCYETGCRKSEALGLRWEQIANTTEGSFVRLNAGETKNKRGRLVPLSKLMSGLLNEIRNGQIADMQPHAEYVFSFRGCKLKNFRTGWAKATKRAGRPDLLFHDLRRSAVRNMVRSGVPEAVCMAVSGHKTRSVFDRYNIVDEADLLKATQAMEERRSDLLKVIAGEENTPKEIRDLVEGAVPFPDI